MVEVEVDAKHGGRWTSLRSSGREWLWSRHAPGRASVRPGDPFVDAGGLEECIPTIGGPPDHGDAWAREWRVEGDRLAVDGDGYRLERRITTADDTVTAAYRVSAEPGWRFIWAAHALLDLRPGARIVAPPGHPATVVGGGADEEFTWPRWRDAELDVLGPDDGTALMITLADLDRVAVVDGDDRLEMALSVEGAPASIAIWRNLGGWPDDAPYRNIGVEPMVGRIGELRICRPGDAAVVPASGELSWTLTLSFSPA
ncbi:MULTISPECIES: hypothetical protein [Saccharothrix]|uniref:hypothetical protein n=1 Tax=Saccharothrix TaxID=2071 RepID=UPI00093D49BB|nr:hypothetical protein [Saccharothrix sp. CB00851]OKI31970.1 hypothetical protein A6A25_26330 [Saccharothrix sp. CB00851]